MFFANGGHKFLVVGQCVLDYGVMLVLEQTMGAIDSDS